VVRVRLVEGAGAARKVAAVQRLHLHDLGAQIRQVLRAEGSGQSLGEIQNLHALQGPGGHGRVAHRSAQWLARLISMRRSPWKTTLSSWLTP
jgi:hypothetical protein